MQLRIFAILSLILCVAFSGYAQPAISGSRVKTAIQLVSSSQKEIRVDFEVGKVSLNELQSPQGKQYKVIVDEGTQLLVAGAPDLPKLTASVVIPDQAAMEVTVLSATYKDYSDIEIAPSKGTLPRTINPEDVAFIYGSAYATDAFYPSALATLREPFILRDKRGQTIIVNPVQYNPVTKVLRVYSHISVKVSVVTNGEVKNPLREKNNFKGTTPEFKQVYRSLLLNYVDGEATAKYTPLEEHGNMLIICPDIFKEVIKPFVRWKQQEGIETEVVSVATAGGMDDSLIRQYVSNYYNTKGLTYLVLVGDAAQVPSCKVRVGFQLLDSDMKYGYITGSDHYPEIFVGRFSATTEEELRTQVGRSVIYERKPMMGDWFKKGICIGSSFGKGDDNEDDWEHERNLRSRLLGYTYSSVTELYDGDHPGGSDLAGNPSTSDLSETLDNGASVLNYTGHGTTISLLTTGFSVYNVQTLNNKGMLPFVWIVGCQTGNFVSNTSFSETLMRSENSTGDAVGSVVNFCATMDQFWDEPMEAQDAFNDILTENDSTGLIRRTFGGISVNGCMQMNDKYGQKGYETTDTWVCFGDPSLMVRTDIPTQLTATHAPGVWLGATSFQVLCNTDGALVCLWSAGKILGTGTVAGKNAIINFASPLNISDTMWVTVTHYNMVPYQAPVFILDFASAPLVNADAGFDVYPNPTNSSTTVSYTSYTAEPISISVINPIGQVVKTTNTEAPVHGEYNYTLPAGDLTSGIYVIELRAGDKRYFRKLVVQ